MANQMFFTVFILLIAIGLAGCSTDKDGYPGGTYIVGSLDVTAEGRYEGAANGDTPSISLHIVATKPTYVKVTRYAYRQAELTAVAKTLAEGEILDIVISTRNGKLGIYTAPPNNPSLLSFRQISTRRAFNEKR